MRDTFRRRLKTVHDPAKVLEFPTKRRGRPFLTPDEVDLRFRKHLVAIRDCGGRVNRRITIATGIGVVRALRPSLLPEHGGSLVLGRAWAESLLRRMDFVRRKGTKAAKKVPDNFPEICSAFLERVATAVKEHNIPPQLVLNMDETGLPIIPVSEWSLDEKGTTQVPIVGLEDKRQITAVLSCTATGKLLSAQLLYQGNNDSLPPAEGNVSRFLGHLALGVVLVHP